MPSGISSVPIVISVVKPLHEEAVQKASSKRQCPKNPKAQKPKQQILLAWNGTATFKDAPNRHQVAGISEIHTPLTPGR
jgi:hypothetical protein